MVQVMFKMADWQQWSVVYYSTRFLALCGRDNLRRMGYQAEVV